MFDGKALAAALEPPSFVDADGVVHVGRLWSHAEYVGWLPKWRDWIGKADDEVDDDVRAMVAAMGLPADKLFALPHPVVTAALESFFVCQQVGRRNGGNPPDSTPA